MALDRRHFLHGGTLGLGAATLLGVDLHAGQKDAQPKPAKNTFLEENFAPVFEEVTARSLEVIGEIPKDLRGLFVRNGPNPKFANPESYHWFDGDGMLHGVHLEGGKASYRNRWVRTEGFLAEEKAKKKLYSGLAERPPLAALTSGKSPYKNASNVNLVHHAGKLLSLTEGGEPYEINGADLATVGRFDLGGKSRPITAHPKIDPATGDLIGFIYTPQPFCVYFHYDAKGAFVRSVKIDLQKGVMMHDFAITARHAILMELPQLFELSRMFQGASPFWFDEKRPARFGVLDRTPGADGKLKIKWFEAATCFVFHTLNAWEEGDEVILVGCRYPRFPGLLSLDSTKPTGHEAASNDALIHRWRFNMKTGATKEERLADMPVEFPRIDERLTGRAVRYGWYGAAANGDFINAIIRHDLNTGNLVRHEFGPGRFGGEPVFVPKAGGKGELDGWVMTYVFDQGTGKSELIIVDAGEPAGKPIARVRLPVRVPYGFHGLWVDGQTSA
jgi:carotenoid cleavage dioxygenase